MTAAVLTAAGWMVAIAALVAVAATRRALGARRDAVAAACHELRGPLGAATLGLELARRHGSLPAVRLRAIELELGRAALALEDLEGAEGGCARRGEESVDVHALLADCVEAWRPAAARRDIALRLCWSGPPALVTGDRLRLAQAVGNLIGNAIEHGGGEVEVSGRLRAEGVRIDVLDGGPGLARPVAQLINGGRRPGRHGHGLRIAHAVATAHGGRLAGAPSDRGARLVLELPAAADPGSVRAGRPST